MKVSVLGFILIVFLFHISEQNDYGSQSRLTNSWAVEIDGGETVADSVAKYHGFVNKGKIGDLDGHYHFEDPEHTHMKKHSLHTKHINLMNDVKVVSAEQQVAKRRTKRQIVSPKDNWWPKQWYLHRKNRDMNIQTVWDQGITGKGVVVTILDDGIEYTHSDLKRNYDQNASYDYNSNDPDPAPRYDITNENKHGTRCAGEVAAALNTICSVGVAYNARIGGIRMLDGEVTDIVEAKSLSFNRQHIDIYSSSWGPTDNGKTVDGPGKLAKLAFLKGIEKGRNGKGSIFVWASGNGGASGDSCNCDGYAVSLYTISIGSVTERDDFPWYAEKCSSNLAATYSSGSGGEHKIVTTDLHNQCTDRHTGTSAAAPLAAGLIALILEIRPDLTWRDVQYIIVYSSNPSIPHDNHWITNGAGLKVSLKYGFGLMDATALVNRARHWIRVIEKQNCTIIVNLTNEQQSSKSSFEVEINVSDYNCPKLQYLEHVQAVTSISVIQGMRGGLQISLRSPSGTLSMLLPHRRRDQHKQGFRKWPFMTVMSWGETAIGKWIFIVSTNDNTKFNITDLALVLHGLPQKPQSVVNIPHECSSECKRGCSKIGTKYCDECQNKQILPTLSCVKACPSKTYIQNQYCMSCPNHCSQCSDSKNCTHCDEGYFILPSGLCSSSCGNSSILVNGSCFPCHISCKYCNGLTSSDCTQCHDLHYRLIEGKCIFHTNCSTGEYFEHRILGCKKCNETCLECTGRGGNQCSKCASSRILLNGKCIQKFRVCYKNEYFNYDTQSCATCSPNCLSCQNETMCHQCDSQFYLHSVPFEHSESLRTFCVKSCPAGYYEDKKSSRCSQCSLSCATCKGNSSHCTSCIHFGALAEGGHCPLCLNNEFYDQFSGQCHVCPTNCSSCLNNSYCTNCISNIPLNSQGQCLQPCTNYTVESLSGHCEFSKCHNTCRSCVGPGNSDCLSCFDHKVLFHNSCISACPNGWYRRNSFCVKCHNTCRVCTGPSEGECVSCHADKYLDNFHCLHSCRKGYYASDENKCFLCASGCLMCVKGSTCVECRPNHVLGPSGHCMLHCPSNYSNINSTCILHRNTPSATLSTTVSSSTNWTVFISFVTFLLVFGIVSIVGIFLWKRQSLFQIRGGKIQYFVLDSHQSEFEMNEKELIDSESETEVFTHLQPKT